MKSCLTIVGARPQFIKAAPVSRALAKAGIRESLLHTGQHYDSNMSASFFRELDVPEPRFNLEVGSGPHGRQTAAMISGIEEILAAEKPDWVVVFGDTNSTLAGALAAVKMHIPVAHIEAGLRSFNRRMPEEINRVVADHTSTLLFTPTKAATENLLREGISQKQIRQVGDVMFDLAASLAARARTESTILQRLQVRPGSYAVVTLHRAENTESDERIDCVLAAVRECTATIPVIFPVHPRTRRILADRDTILSAPNLHLIDPLGYLDFTALCAQARVVATDSGGVQKEAYFHRVPCLTLRNETEWVELVELGWNQLVPPVSAGILVEAILSAAPPATTFESEGLPYGDGRAAQHIARALSAAGISLEPK